MLVRPLFPLFKHSWKRRKTNEKVLLLNCDYKKALEQLKNQNEQFDIIFLDPPYKDDIAVDSLKQIIKNKLLNNKGIVVIETDEVNRDLKILNLLDHIFFDQIFLHFAILLS